MVWTRGVTAKLYYKLRSQEGAYMVVTSEITVATALRSEQGLYETWVPSLGWEDPLEKGTAAHSSLLAWRIPWTVSSTGPQRVGHD